MNSDDMQDSIQKALIEELNQICKYSTKIVRVSDEELLHELRVSMLRMQSALMFFRKEIDYNDRFLIKLCRARKIMGEVRNIDIISSRLNKDFRGLVFPISKQSKISKMIRVRREIALGKLRTMLSSVWYKKMLQEFRAMLLRKPIVRLDVKDVLNGLVHRVRRNQGTYGPKKLHKLRIAFKNLRYACEWFAVFYKKKQMKRMVYDITKLQDILGKYHDIIITIDLLKDFKKMNKALSINKIIEFERRCLNDFRDKLKAVMVI